MAIARDGAGQSTTSFAASATWSHTVNGPNPILWVGAWMQLSATATATYNGVSMYNPVNATFLDGTIRLYLWYITGQTGTHNIVVTSTTSDVVVGTSMAFSGASQITGEPTSSGNLDRPGVGTVNCNLTTADQGWMVMFEIDQTSGNSTPISPAVQDKTEGSSAIYSQGAYSGAGSHTLGVTAAHGDTVHVFASFAQAGSTASTKLNIGRLRPNAFAPGTRR